MTAGQAAPALRPGPRVRRRVLFGLLDSDGWGWASVKAFFWFIVIIFLLGYIPDRAYYFTVNRTLDLGIIAISPVNFCPAENRLPQCPVPVGAVLPWEISPATGELELPTPRTDAAAVQLGSRLLLIGGTDGTGPTDEVLIAELVGTGTFDRWEQGPPLPEPRADAAVAFLGGSIYVVGGRGPDDAPTDTTYVLTPNAETGELGEWQEPSDELPLTLPAARAGASLVALGDGLLLVGGSGPDRPATRTVWKATLDSDGNLQAWAPTTELNQPSTQAIAVQNGGYVWLYAGSDGDAPTRIVQRGALSGEEGAAVGPAASPGAPAQTPEASPSPGAGEGQAGTVIEHWDVDATHVTDLPEARQNAMGWAANGAMYVVGGNDGTGPRNQVWWTIPDANGNFTEWRHLPESDLPAGLEGAAMLVTGPNTFLIGGQSAEGVLQSSVRTNTAPQEPFFRLGLVGVVVPALKIDGEVGQQLGYLNAAGAGTVNFIILLLIAWGFSHPDRVRAMWDRVRRR